MTSPPTLRTAALVLLGAAVSFPVAAQSRAVVEQERRDFAEWLRTAPLSPLRAVGVFALGSELTLGPVTAAVPLAGVEPARLTEREGRVSLQLPKSKLQVARGRPLSLGDWHLVVGGLPGGSSVTVFAAEPRSHKTPLWFPYDPKAVYLTRLVPPDHPGTVRVLAPDGVEVEANEAGSIAVTLAGAPRTLRVLRLPGASEDESELEIYFRDTTNDSTSYPAGRFVSLIPQPGDRYLVDFNRARNPFCAYNTVYPCPAPWRGNALPLSVQAGERYQGGGLPPKPDS